MIKIHFIYISLGPTGLDLIGPHIIPVVWILFCIYFTTRSLFLAYDKLTTHYITQDEQNNLKRIVRG